GDLRERFLGEICAATGASPVQHIGKILVVYRERSPEAPPAAPAAKASPRRQSRPALRPGRRAPRQAKLRSR
ncbi:MAG: ribosome assembly RNA-binding protein YhbY, partial [Bacteroidota bacterium]